MSARCLRRGKSFLGFSLEPEAQVGVGEESGDLLNCLFERVVAIGHERSPFGTTHNDLRLAVDALSGGFRAGLFARSLTIYAERAGSVRLGSKNCLGALTNHPVR